MSWRMANSLGHLDSFVCPACENTISIRRHGEYAQYVLIYEPPKPTTPDYSKWDNKLAEAFKELEEEN